MINKEIGEKIRQLRKGWGLSQIELAEKVGISFQQIQKYEKGVTRISVTRLHQISEALGVGVGSFFPEKKNISFVKDDSAKYHPDKKPRNSIQPLSSEEKTLLKLFRKLKNNKIRKGLLKQIQGIIELEKLL